MYCTKCGKTIDGGFDYCPYCGTKAFRESDGQPYEAPSVRSAVYDVPGAAVLDETEKMMDSPYASEKKTPYEPEETVKSPYEPDEEKRRVYTPEPEKAEEAVQSAFVYPQNGRDRKFHSGLGWSVFLTILSVATLCPLSLVLSIIGIATGGAARGRRRKGDFEGARAKARAARALNWTAFILILLWIALIVLSVYLGYAAFSYGGTGFNYSLDADRIAAALRDAGVCNHAVERFLERDNLSVDWKF